MYSTFLKDFNYCCSRLRIIFYIAILENKSRFRSSKLGFLWSSLIIISGSFGIGLVWSEVFNVDKKEFIFNLSAGIVFWQFFSTVITDASNYDLNYKPIYLNYRQPLLFFIILFFTRNFLNLIQGLLIFIFIFLIFNFDKLSLIHLFLPFHLIIFYLSMLFLSISVVILSARYSDIKFLIQSSLPFLFFLSPILIKSTGESNLQKLFYFNPITYYLDFIRDPFLGITNNIFSLLGFIFITFVTFFISLYLYKTYSNKITLWN